MIYIRDPPTPMIFRNSTCYMYVVSMSPLREPSHRFDRTQQMSLSNFYFVCCFFLTDKVIYVLSVEQAYLLTFVSNFHHPRYF